MNFTITKIEVNITSGNIEITNLQRSYSEQRNQT
jgi:hypothetical protein